MSGRARARYQEHWENVLAHRAAIAAGDEIAAARARQAVGLAALPVRLFTTLTIEARREMGDALLLANVGALRVGDAA